MSCREGFYDFYDFYGFNDFNDLTIWPIDELANLSYTHWQNSMPHALCLPQSEICSMANPGRENQNNLVEKTSQLQKPICLL